MSENEKVEKVKKVEVIPRGDDDAVAADVPAKNRLPGWFPWAAAGVAALFIILASYAVGYNAARGSTADSANERGANSGITPGGGMNGTPPVMDGTTGRGRGQMGGTVGEVTAVSSSSITINDQMRGGSVTYTITSDTKVAEDDTDKAVSDIHVGDTVRVIASTSDLLAAATITLNVSTN